MSEKSTRPPAISTLLGYVGNLKAATKTGKNDLLIVEPVSIGDIFQTLTLVNQLKRSRKTEKINFVSSRRSTQIIKLFNNVNNVLELNHLHIDYSKMELLANSKWYESQQSIILPCTANHIVATEGHSGTTEWVSAFLLENPMEFRKKNLGLPASARPELPEIPQAKREAALASALRQGLKPDSLIIFNHAHSAKPLPPSIYQPLLDLFPGGIYFDAWDKDAPKWAKPLQMSLADVPVFADFAGSVLTVRSGMTDLLSMSKANIYTIYPDTNWLSPWFQEDPRAVAAFRSHGIRDLQLNPDSMEKKIFIENAYTTRRMGEKIRQVVSGKIPADG